MFGKWVSIKDEFPDIYDWVLVSYVDNTSPKLRYIPEVAEWKSSYWESRSGDNLEIERNVTVTHWMTLPSSPK